MKNYILAVSAALSTCLASNVVAQNFATSKDWPNTVARAKKEAKVFLYSGSPQEHVERLANGFRKAYPEISVVVARASTGELMAKIDQERSAGIDESADVWIGAEKAWFLARAKESTLLKPVGPAVAGWPQQAMIAETVVEAARFPFVIMYNTKLIATPPQTYADLLKPEFRGKMGLTEAPGATQLAYYEWLERTQGVGYLAKLKSQGVKLFAGAPQASQALAAGEVAVVPGVVTISNARPLAALGAPVAYTMPTPALGGNYHMAAFGWSKRPNAALVLLDWLMSTEGQTVWHGTGESASPRTGIPGALSYTAITPSDLSEYTPEVFKLRVDRWNKIFKF